MGHGCNYFVIINKEFCTFVWSCSVNRTVRGLNKSKWAMWSRVIYSQTVKLHIYIRHLGTFRTCFWVVLSTKDHIYPQKMTCWLSVHVPFDATGSTDSTLSISPAVDFFPVRDSNFEGGRFMLECRIFILEALGDREVLFTWWGPSSNETTGVCTHLLSWGLQKELKLSTALLQEQQSEFMYSSC